MPGRDVHQHDRVGVVGLVVAGVQDVLLVRGQAGPGVVPVDQDVLRARVVHRRPVAEVNVFVSSVAFSTS